MSADLPDRAGPIGVVSIDWDTDEARCSIHGLLHDWHPEEAAEKHVEAQPDCWANHCGGKGCSNADCACAESRNQRAEEQR